MNETALLVRIASLVLLLLAGAFAYAVPHFETEREEDLLSVSFLDVGQGDAILIETPDGVDVLIDGGPDGSVLRGLASELGAFDRTIDMVVATHPDADHVGGLADVLVRYEVNALLMTEHAGGGTAADAFRHSVGDEGADLIYARSGQEFALGSTTALRVLFPTNDPSDMQTNASSIVLELTYGDVEMLLMGDAPAGVEAYLVATEGSTLQSDVLKVGHHGSDTSSSDVFLAVAAPDYAVISAGRDNRYGHPHPDVVARLEHAGVAILSTAESGTITLLSDGVSVWEE